MAHNRHAQRVAAFQTLYSLFFTPADTEAELHARFVTQPTEDDAAPQPQGEDMAFSWALVLGVWRYEDRLNSLIVEVSGRGLERIGRVEQVLLRLASYEMLAATVEIKIAISEAVILANEFADERSRQFINGILNGVARKVQQERLSLPKAAV